MARTDPCMFLLKQGVVKGKWSYLDIPDSTQLSRLLNE